MAGGEVTRLSTRVTRDVLTGAARTHALTHRHSCNSKTEGGLYKRFGDQIIARCYGGVRSQRRAGERGDRAVVGRYLPECYNDHDPVSCYLGNQACQQLHTMVGLLRPLYRTYVPLT